jgi:hypothetical protein
MRVGDVLEALAEGVSEDAIVADFPYLTREDVRACLAYAAAIANDSANGSVSSSIPPGSYTPETLPPISDGARKILASLDSVAPFVAEHGAGKDVAGDPAIELEDDGVGIDLADEGLPGIDPGR